MFSFNIRKCPHKGYHPLERRHYIEWHLLQGQVIKFFEKSTFIIININYKLETSTFDGLVKKIGIRLFFINLPFKIHRSYFLPLFFYHINSFTIVEELTTIF